MHREGLLRWRRIHRLVGQIGLLPCVSLTHTLTHTHSNHTPPARVNETTRVKTEREREKAGLVDQVPVVSRVFPTLPLSAERSRLQAGGGVFLHVCVSVIYVQEQVQNRPGSTNTLVFHPSIHLSVRPSRVVLWPFVLQEASHARGGSQLVEQDVGVAAAHLAGGHWRYSGVIKGVPFSRAGIATVGCVVTAHSGA